MKKPFIHLRCLSSYSLSESTLKIKKLVEIAKKNKMPALAITDNNNMFGVFEFAQECIKNNIQPIIGTSINLIDVQIKNKGQPKKLATKKERGELVFVNSKMSNPATNKMVLKGLDGTTESLYSQLRIEQEAMKNGMEKNLKYILENNVALGKKDLDNLFYNAKTYNDLTKKVSKLGDDLVNDGKEPEKIYQNFRRFCAFILLLEKLF